MRTETPREIHLADYRPPAFQIDTVELDFQLEPHNTRVKARLAVRRNGDHAEPLVLDGMRLKLAALSIDGERVAKGDYDVGDETLTVRTQASAFTLETEVEIDPEGNTALEGLYMSGGRFCTQCEAEGFRKITWYPDRPDVLSRFTVRMQADKARFPTLLSNGNRTGGGGPGRGRPHAERAGPFPQ